MQINEFLNYFNGKKLIGDKQYLVKCPNHNDEKASLSISEENNKILMHCFAGCDTKDILRKIGLKEKDLFNTNNQQESKVVAEYYYKDENGQPLYRVKRYNPKSFSQEKYENDRWVYNMENVKRVLYNLHNVLNSNNIYFVEGEKDADNLNSIGLVATTTVGGAQGFKKYQKDYVEYLRNKKVYIIPDNDSAGRKYAMDVKNALKGISNEAKIIDLVQEVKDLKPKGDISDVLSEYGKDKTIEILEKLTNMNTIEEKEFPIHSIEELNEENFSKLLKDLGITLKFDLITKKVIIKGMPDKFAESDLFNIISIYLKNILRNNGIKIVSTKTIDEFITIELAKNNFNPVLDMLNKGTWDKRDRLDELYSILGIKDEFHKTLVKKWLYQTVAMLFNTLDNPIGAEGVLTLQGKQGIGKSRFFYLLALKPEWFIDGVSIDMNNRDSIIKATSRWIVEIGELDSTVKREQSSLKAFITSSEDDIRPPYGKNSIRRARNTSFCATVNPFDFLKDSTGNRRFWVIPIKNIDIQKLESNGKEWILQLWLQIYEDVTSYYKRNGNYNIFRLTPEEREKLEKENLNYTEFLPYEEDLLQLFDKDCIKSEWTNRELIDTFFENATPVMLGRAINKIKNNYPELVEIKRTNIGNKYLLPIKKEIKKIKKCK